MWLKGLVTSVLTLVVTAMMVPCVSAQEIVGWKSKELQSTEVRVASQTLAPKTSWKALPNFLNRHTRKSKIQTAQKHLFWGTGFSGC